VPKVSNSTVDNCSAVAEMGGRLATIDMGRKFGGAVPFWKDRVGPYVTQ